ncbi:hypothetical protein VNO77_09689 [Canavalia gladiata]|uniref:Uncharacterized protein n=1 Tax=Canavalia gladiata TaxID=3824 RepID=A0AAN9MEZ9_CANGL
MLTLTSSFVQSIDDQFVACLDSILAVDHNQKKNVDINIRMEGYSEAKALGVNVISVLIGHVPYLLLSKAAKGYYVGFGETNDRTFRSLQDILLPKRFTGFAVERTIRISMAVSIIEACHKSPDRDVTAKQVQGYLDNPILAQGLCLLQRRSVLDAKAYPEASKSVLQILWNLVTYG